MTIIKINRKKLESKLKKVILEAINIVNGPYNDKDELEITEKEFNKFIQDLRTIIVGEPEKQADGSLFVNFSGDWDEHEKLRHIFDNYGLVWDIDYIKIRIV